MLRVDLPDRDVQILGDRVCRVLEQVGMKFQNDTILEALRRFGAVVDEPTQVAKFPRSLLDDFVESVKREYLRPRPDTSTTQFAPPGLASVTTQVAQYVYDYDRQERRSGKSADLVDFTKLGDMLHRDQGVGHCLLLTDVPPLVEPMEALLLLAEHAHRPHGAFAWNLRQADYLAEMGEILGIEYPYSFGAVCIAHPLRFDRPVADRYVAMVRDGHAGGLTAMPVAGLSTPITVEGFIVVSTAEQLGAWIAARAMNPKAPLGGSIWAGTPDMKVGHISFSNFDSMFYAIATAQFTRQWCGVRIAVGGGEYSNAKRPGLYAALEKAYKAMIIAAFTGDHPSIGEGMLDTGKVLSDVQLLLEREFATGLEHLARTVTATEENIAFPTILEAGIGERSNYFQSDHTARNFRSSLWLPAFLDRTGWDGFEKEEQMMRRLRDKARSLIAEYVKPEGRQDKLAAARRVVEKARKDLLV
jgi:trimethylamine:corrinoid methyltransferase-like protein